MRTDGRVDRDRQLDRQEDGRVENVTKFYGRFLQVFSESIYDRWTWTEIKVTEQRIVEH